MGPQERHGADVVIDPSLPTFNSNALIQERTTPVSCEGDGFVINHSVLVLGWTFEKVKLPAASRIGARVEGKSSLARIGLGIHVTAPTIHPGFGEDLSNPDFPGSEIRLEIWNISPLKIRLRKGLPICQLIFEEVHGTPTVGYSGQHAIQGPDVR